MNPLDFFKHVHHYASHLAFLPSLFSSVPTYAKNGAGTLGKSKLSVFCDFLYLFFIVKLLPENYYLFGFHTKSWEEFKTYMDGPIAPLLKHRLYKAFWDEGYTCLVNDKVIFDSICRSQGIPVPRMYGILSDGIIKGTGADLRRFMEESGLDAAILKPVGGGQGQGIYFTQRTAGSFKVKPVVSGGSVGDEAPGKGEFVVQEVVKQHAAMDRINPNCLNTVRIITLFTVDRKVQFLAGMLRTSSGHMPIDNFSLGGMVVKVDMASGRLVGPGIMKEHQHIRRVQEHPFTGVPLDGFQVPCWEEIRECAVKAQMIFHNLKAIGWDFAVAENGPVLIEGNIEWGTAGIQATNGGLLTPENRRLFAQYGLTFPG